MAGEINALSGAITDAPPSPVAASVNRSYRDRLVAASKPQGTPAPEKTQEDSLQGTAGRHHVEDSSGESPEGPKRPFPSRDTTLSFERDSEDGRMYLHVKDRKTGEEIYRIPKNYLKNMDPHPGEKHKLDVHI